MEVIYQKIKFFRKVMESNNTIKKNNNNNKSNKKIRLIKFNDVR